MTLVESVGERRDSRGGLLGVGRGVFKHIVLLLNGILVGTAMK